MTTTMPSSDARGASLSPASSGVLDLLPRALGAPAVPQRLREAAGRLVRAVRETPRAITRVENEVILLAVAARFSNGAASAAHRAALLEAGLENDDIEPLARGGDPPRFTQAELALLAFARRLVGSPTPVGPEAIRALRQSGWTDGQILEAAHAAGLGRFLATLHAGSEPFGDWETSTEAAESESFEEPERSPGPYLDAPTLDEKAFPPFALLRRTFGFVPNLFRARTLHPDVLEAEALAVRDVFPPSDLLTPEQKELIVLAVSAVDRNAYGIGVHAEIASAIGVDPDLADAVARDFRTAALSDGDRRLLEAAVARCVRPAGRAVRAAVPATGLAEAHAVEMTVTAAFAAFWNVVQAGTGAVPDFPPRFDFEPRPVNPAAADARLIENAGERASAAEDPDAPLVARTRAGDTEAFESLVRRHQGRVYRTLVSITGNAADAEDGTQAVFLKVFRKLSDFAGSAKFSTWITRIAVNEGLERVRSRKETDSLDARDEEEFRPSRVGRWEDDPESLVARDEMRRIVQEALAGLPLRYRTAVMLRDIEQLSTAEAAAALDLPIPTLKTRLLRGRLLLREALAPRFMAGRKDVRV